MLKIVTNLEQFAALQSKLDHSVISHLGVFMPFDNVTLKAGNSASIELWICEQYLSNVTDVTHVVVDPMYKVNGSEKEWKAEIISLDECIRDIRNAVTDDLMNQSNDKIAHEVFDEALGVDDVQDAIEGF